MAEFAGEFYVRWKPVELAQVINGPTGPVMRHLLNRAEIVRQGAKRRVGYSKPDPLGRPYPKANHLRDTIVKRMGRVGSEAAILIGSDDPVALIHHEGTVPHVIVPKRAPRLVFMGRDGTVVYARRVNHPGTKPNRYLTDSLEDLRGNV